MATICTFSEEIDGQYRLFPMDACVPSNDFLELKNYSKKGIKLFETIRKKMLEKGGKLSLEKFSLYQKNLEDFIVGYFRLYDSFSLEEVFAYYENSSDDYHLLGRYFLFYLHTFIYKDSIISELKESLFIRMENFIFDDPIHYRRKEDRIVLEEIRKRKNLRVGNYIVYHETLFKNLLEDMTKLKEDISDKENTKLISVKNSVVSFLEDKNLQNVIFEHNELGDNKELKNGFVSVALLEYLEYYGYKEAENKQNKHLQKQIDDMENLVVLCYSPSIQLTGHQENIYVRIKEKVALRTQGYVRSEVPKLFDVISHYKRLEKFLESNKKRMISRYSTDLPDVYTKEEVKQKLEIFLFSVLYLTRSFEVENIPLFVNGLEDERNQVFTLALTYLSLFVYSVSKDDLYEDPFISRLESYISICKDFKVTDSDLCVAKSILYNRVSLRSSLQDVAQAKKILKNKHS